MRSSKKETKEGVNAGEGDEEGRTEGRSVSQTQSSFKTKRNLLRLSQNKALAASCARLRPFPQRTDPDSVCVARSSRNMRLEIFRESRPTPSNKRIAHRSKQRDTEAEQQGAGRDESQNHAESRPRGRRFVIGIESDESGIDFVFFILFQSFCSPSAHPIFRPFLSIIL